MMRRACARCGASSMMPSIWTAPLSLASKAAITRSDQRRSSSVGVKQRLMISTCERMDRSLCGKSVATGRVGLAFQLVVIAKIGEHGVDRCHPCRAGGQQAKAAGQREWRRILAVLVAVCGRPDGRGQVLAAPQQSGQARMSPGFCRKRQRGRGRLGADGDDPGLVAARALPTCRSGHRGDARSSGPSGFGSMMPSGRAGITASRSPAHQALSSALTRT